MRKDYELLKKAAEVATRRRDKRTYYLGALGRRADGALVRATNGAAESPRGCVHAEARLATRLDVGAEVWVVRVRRMGGWGLAKPCPSCALALRRRGVKRVCYSTGPSEYEVMRL